MTRKFDAGVSAGIYPAVPSLMDSAVDAFAALDDQREWEVRLRPRIANAAIFISVNDRCLRQLLMEYVLPFASMIKIAALPNLPAPPALPDYGTHKARLVICASLQKNAN